MSQQHWVIKANGEREIFDEEKLRSSLLRSGAGQDDTDTVVVRILSEMKEGMSTEKIYRHAFALLKRLHKGVAAQYSLRRAIREMGPSGFPFEQYVGEIFRTKGYEVKTDQIVQGWCVDHEVDVSAKKEGTHILIECKFHNEEGFKTDLKVALYVRERFQDIQKKHESVKDVTERFHEAWLVTNTKLTSKAIQYAQCAGLHVIGWNYPRHGNLQDLVNETRMYPITALTTLSGADKRRLMESGIVLFRDLFQKRNVMHGIGIDELKIDRVLSEATALNGMTLT
ncbi:MAG: restriction endonuclease [Candidatus Paceibacterota bacterium]|jgi:hypothetical protein|nr:restriction endonuclease [Candidatus Paceibacterota bacterium]